MATVTGLVGWNTIAGGEPNINTGAVRAGGTSFTHLSLISLPSVFDGESESVADAVANNQSVASGTDGTTSVGAATQIRELVETNVADEIIEQVGGLHRKVTWREPDVTGLSLLRDGRYVDSGGTIFAHPTNAIVVTGEILAGSGDLATYTQEEGPQTYNYKMGSQNVEKNLPARN